jgi:CelD/BcsL family acetyltransferase involved in cellulose biosynthesis
MSHSEQLARKFDDRVAARDAAAVAAAAVARRHPGTPPRADAELQVDVAASITALEELAGDYARLHSVARNVSPFALHAWHVAWCRHFLNLDRNVRDELAVLTLRDAGDCVAIVPLVVSHRRFGPLKIVSINLLGADPSTTESRTPLLAPGYEERAARAVRHYLARQPSWDWINWSGITEEFGSAFALGGRGPRQPEAPGYVLDLAPTWTQFRARLRRNIRESLRHCYNSLKREGLAFEFEIATEPADVRRGLERFLELHAMRARMPSTIEHPDHFVSDVSRRFLFDVCERLTATGTVRVFQLRIGAEVVAVRIGFVVGGCLYLYYSGFDPRWARYGAMTTTVAEAMKYAIAQGLTTVNLSRGTDTSKTRWGPREVRYTCAIEPRPRLVSRLAFHCYDSARAGRGLPFWLLQRFGQAHRAWQ